MKPIVVKIGGGTLAGSALEDLKSVVSGGTPVVLMHGGGNRLTRMLDALEIPTRFHEGLRVTDEQTIEVAEMVFAGQVNKSLVRELNELGVPAVGISGTDGPTLHVSPIPELGRVGKVERVDARLIRTLLGGGFVPAVAPLGLGPEGAYNVNADSAAAAIAGELAAEQLFLLTDVDGLLRDGEVIAGINAEECEHYVRDGLAVKGMIPKLRAASGAARRGVRVRILNGNKPGAIERALAGEQVGTLVTERVVA
jgi:acetylglutamate kinase